MNIRLLSAVAITFLIVACESCKSENDYYSISDFAAVKKIDAHVHIETNDSSTILQAQKDNFQLLTINYDDVNEGPPILEQQRYAVKQVKQFPALINFTTGVSIRNFNNPNWNNETIQFIHRAILSGAKAVKVYKVIGMSLRDTSGKLVMVDDDRFDSLFNYLSAQKIPVVGHLGEPRNCWLPVEQMTVKGDQSYFSRHPEYHMFKHPEMPSYEQQVAARDNRVARDPDLVFIGAHLGSLEWNVDSLAARLDRFPNMAVDIAARIVHFQVQARDNWQKVHDFMVKYSDRILYATDKMATAGSNPAEEMSDFHETWINDWKFLTSDQTITSNEFEGSFKGLHLPKKIIDRIYHDNAQKWLKIFPTN
ncbi:MAG TPA: amidohydrolase family protein [Flavitalea sp.]|nr:amidohydrolase family protein [Flavitalea sp.]